MDPELEESFSPNFASSLTKKLINYEGFYTLDTYAEIADAIENFEVRDDDVWVCSFPRTGTTWTQEMVWGIMNDINSEAAKVSLRNRFPFLEFTGTTSVGWAAIRKSKEGLQDHEVKSVEYASNLPSPRFLKCHLPFHLLPRQLRTGEKKNKIVNVSRNPKDACISFYHHHKLLEGYIGNFENFVKLFLADNVNFAPFWEHIIGYWEKKDEENILFLKYEDMKTDLPSIIRKTANFLGKSLNDKQIRELEDHLSFEKMKNNPSVNFSEIVKTINQHQLFGSDFKSEGEFIRKGLTGQWKTEMTKEMVEKFDNWTKEKLKNHPDLLKEFP